MRAEVDVVRDFEAVLHPLDHLGRVGHERVEPGEDVLESPHQQCGRPAARQGSPVVELRQLGVEIGIVDPQLEQLRVGELQ